MTGLTSEVLWAALPIPALVIGQGGQIEAANGAAEDFLNLSARSLLGHPLLDKIRCDVPLADALLRVRQDSAPVFVAEADLTLTDRAPVSCGLVLSCLPGTAAQILLLITPHEMAGRIGLSQRTASSARAAIGMAEMLAHEIKNPLAGIAGAAQLLAMGLGAADLQMTDLIVQETQRIVKLLEQVERFGNLRPPELRAVNVHDALERARRSARLGFAAQMKLIEDYDPSLPLVLADGDQLMQVFLNLLKNAAEAAGPAGGTIRLRSFYDRALRLRLPDGTQAALPLHIEIIDDGPGIAPGLAAAMFEPFVSGKANGTGLGLALVSRIITEHGGWIAAESAPGRTVFRISLPLAPKAAAARWPVLATTKEP